MSAKIAKKWSTAGSGDGFAGYWNLLSPGGDDPGGAFEKRGLRRDLTPFPEKEWGTRRMKAQSLDSYRLSHRESRGPHLPYQGRFFILQAVIGLRFTNQRLITVILNEVKDLLFLRKCALQKDPSLRSG
jgi:hypothetical protein